MGLAFFSDFAPVACSSNWSKTISRRFERGNGAGSWRIDELSLPQPDCLLCHSQHPCGFQDHLYQGAFSPTVLYSRRRLWAWWTFCIENAGPWQRVCWTGIMIVFITRYYALNVFHYTLLHVDCFSLHAITRYYTLIVFHYTLLHAITQSNNVFYLFASL